MGRHWGLISKPHWTDGCLPASALETSIAPSNESQKTPGICGEKIMASVTIRDVHKAFGSTAVIHGIDVGIADGEFVVLVGPSGCGKSTLLRMIAGLENITSGEIFIGDRVVNLLPPKERDVAMVFQNYALYPHMTVAANLGFSLKLRGAAKQEIGARVSRAADILGLTSYLERFPRQLSGGQRQRVAMGRAIVRDPQVFLFDEPLSNSRRQATRANAHRDQGTASAPEDYDRLRYPRSDRGNDNGGPNRCDARRYGGADRCPARTLRQSAEFVCCRLYRFTGDEFPQRYLED